VIEDRAGTVQDRNVDVAPTKHVGQGRPQLRRVSILSSSKRFGRDEYRHVYITANRRFASRH
jgi:hypothetical protein